VGALDQLLRADHSTEVRAALQVLDPNPFRDAVRDAERDKDAAALVKLAGQPEALVQRPEFAAFLGESKLVSEERRRAMLGTALQQHPGELGLLMALGGTYPLDRREGADERARWYQAAVAVAPNNSAAHTNLGTALADRNDSDGAIAEYREAIRVDPKDAFPRYNLGFALYLKGDLERAIPEYREAIRLGPKYASPHHNLGVILAKKDDLDGAIAEFREAIRLEPKLAIPHNNLGHALMEKGDLEGAIAELREAIRLNPKYANAQAYLSIAQPMRELLPRLPNVLAGKDKPKSPAEGCVFASLCALKFQKRYAEAARFSAEAFTADPSLAEDLKAAHRYNAACYAALAGSGQGQDADKRNAKERAQLRGQALEWLQADLVLRRQQAGSAEAASRREAAIRLAAWLRDPDLAGVRPEPGQVALALPAEERAAWDAFWADVKATLALAQKASQNTTKK
jgi:Flp pilus assembly protein TadD